MPDEENIYRILSNPLVLKFLKNLEHAGISQGIGLDAL